MGVDCWMMPEISHHDEPWRPLRHSDTLYQAPREQAMFALIGDVTNNKGRFTDAWNPPSMHEGRSIPGFWYRPDKGDHDPIEAICEPRGVPDDASPAWRKHVAAWAAKREKIVTTWFTPEELIAANWDQSVYRHGILFEEDYRALAEKGTVPRRWVHSAGGDSLIVSEIEYAAGVRGERSTLVRANWNAGSIRSLSNEFPETLSDLVKMRPETSKMRLMFLFEA